MKNKSFPKFLGVGFLTVLLFFGCDDNQDDIDKLKEQVDQLINQNKDVSSLEANLKNLDERIKSLTTSVGSLPTSDVVKDVVEGEAKKLQGTIDGLENQLKSGQGELTGLSDSIKKINEHLTALELKVNPPTADQVKDDATLKAFVTWAHSEIVALESLSEAAENGLLLRTEGSDFNSESTYLLVVENSGEVLVHGTVRAAEGKNFKEIDDGKLFETIQEAGKKEGGDFFEYQHDGKTEKAYAIGYQTALTGGRETILVGGYRNELSDVSYDIPEISWDGKTSAADVKDEESLKKFVSETVEFLRDPTTLGTYSIGQLRNAFQQEGGHWKSGSVYIWLVSSENYNLFHGANRNLEHHPSNFNRVDETGQKFVEILVNGARDNVDEGKFLEYFYDNPNNENDGPEAKLGYTKSFRFPFTQANQPYIVLGSGIYTGDLKTSAKEVEDAEGSEKDEKLEAFVNWAKTEIQGIADLSEASENGLLLRGEDEKGEKKESDFNSGDTYLISIEKESGEVLIHGGEREAEGKKLEKEILDKIKNAAVEGGFVEYEQGDETKKAYAVEYTSVIGSKEILIGGYTNDLSDIGSTYNPEIIKDFEEISEGITAKDVNDEESLKKFVDATVKFLEGEALGKYSIGELRNAFRDDEKGTWKSGSVYIWLVSSENYNLFHGANSNLEHRPTNFKLQDDKTKRFFVKELVEEARKYGVHTLEYHYDNPANDDDGKEPKFGYTRSFRFPFLAPDQPDIVIGSGFYSGDN